MAGQSITFDFLTRGADRTAADFRKTGDNAALASRGAKVLSEVIEKLGDKEGRTAAESKILASALRQTGEAADRATARMVLADASIRRMSDAMQDSSKHASGLKTALGGLKLNPGLLGPALLLAPAMATLGGTVAAVGVGLAGAFTVGAGALAGFGAVAKPVLTSAKTAADAVAKAQDTYNATIKAGVPTAQAQANLQKANATAQLNYNAALKGGANPAQALATYHQALARNQLAYNSATSKGTFNAKAYAAEQAAIGKAYAGMSPAQIALSKQIGAMSEAWDKVKAAETPVIAGALQPWLKAVTTLMSGLKPIIDTIAPVIKSLGDKFAALVNSAAAIRFRDFVASFGAWATWAAGSTLIDFFKAFMIILPKFAPLIGKATEGIGGLGPAVLKWASSQKTADHITAFMVWFSKNGPAVGDLLKNVGGALKALAPGLASGAALELKIISDFLGLVAKLPPAIAKPLAEVAGAALILSKMGGGKVISFLVTGVLGGIFKGGGAAGAAGGAAAGAEGAAAGGLLSRVGPAGMKWVVRGGVAFAAADIILNIIPSGGPTTSQNPLDKPPFGLPQAFETPFGMPGPKNPKSANNWLTSWSPYERFFTTTLPGWISTGGHRSSTAMNQNFTAISDVVKAKMGEAANNIQTAMASAGTHINALRISHLGPLGSKVDSVTHQTGIMQGVIANPAGTAAGGKNADTLKNSHLEPLRSKIASVDFQTKLMQGTVSNPRPTAAGGAHADTFKNAHLGPLGSKIAAVDAQMRRMQGTTANPAPTTAGGQHTDTFKNAHLAPLGSKIAAVDAQTRGLQGSINALHGKTVNVGVHGSGSGGAKVTISQVGGGAFAGKLVAISNRATGGLIGGGTPGRDSVPIMAMPGEVVVPTSMVRAGAVDHLRGRLPGFAAGGLVTPTPDVWGGRVEAGYGASGASAYGAVMAAAFKAAVASTMNALKTAAAQAVSATRVPNVGSGIARWAPLVRQALSMEGLSQNLQLLVLYQMMTESGGNPNAINLWDSNARAGTPSIGLMQVIAPTFRRWHWPGTSWNIYDPLANIAAALNYARHGRGFGSGAGQLGSGHGYDQGGWLMPGLTLAYNGTGRPEQVIPAGRGAGTTVVLENRGVIGSQAELENWLVRSIDTLKRKRRI